MRGDDTNNGKDPGKITPMDSCRKSQISREDQDTLSDSGSLGELLLHMRRVREAVPVNRQLREELRARLAGMQAQGCASHHQAVVEANGKNTPLSFFQKIVRPRFWWLFPAVILIALLYWLWWSVAAPKALEAGPTREISRFWLEESPLDFTCAPQSRGFLAVRNGALQLLDQYGGQTGPVKAPVGHSYLCPALSPDGSKLAMVRRYDGGGDIIMAAMPAVTLEGDAAQKVETALSKAETLLKVEQGKSLSGLTWSPDGLTLAYVLGESQGKNEIYLLTKGKEPAVLGEGSNPAWSPDGSRLVVERAGESGNTELWMLQSGGSGGAVLLTEGERPAWNSRGYLAFIRHTATERVLTYSPDGAPLFKVQQRQGEIRTINLGSKGDIPSKQKDGYYPLSGDRLLLAPDSKPGAEELNWLRKLELEGVREPRTLISDQTSNFLNLHFSPDGKTLLVARQDGGTVALVQVGLRESLTKGGDR